MSIKTKLGSYMLAAVFASAVAARAQTGTSGGDMSPATQAPSGDGNTAGGSTTPAAPGAAMPEPSGEGSVPSQQPSGPATATAPKADDPSSAAGQNPTASPDAGGEQE